MATKLPKTFEQLAYYSLDSARDSRFRIITFISIVTMAMGVFLFSSTVAFLNTKNYHILFASLCSIIVLLGLYTVAFNQLRGIGYPNFNYFKYNWALNSKKVYSVSVRSDYPEEYGEIAVWLRDNIEIKNYLIIRNPYGKVTSNYNTYLFRYEKDAMLFRLTF